MPLAPPKLRPSGETLIRETSRVEDQVPSALRDPKRVSLPFMESVIPYSGRSSRRKFFRRTPPDISSATIGLPYNLWRILRAREREAIRAKSSNGGRVRKLTAPCLAAGRRGASTLSSSIRLQQLSDHRGAAEGFTSELDSYWLVVQQNSDRARRQPSRPHRLEAHGADGPHPPSLGSPRGAPSYDEDPRDGLP